MFASVMNFLRERAFMLSVLAATLALVGVPILVLLWMTAVPGRSYAGPLPPLTATQAKLAASLRADVFAIAASPHNMARPQALEQVARHIEAALRADGYALRRQPYPVGGQVVRNIEAVIEPATAHAQTLVIGAHYDSAGRAPGANDNGSGVAALLAIARDLAPLGGRATQRIRLVFFVNEEPPFFQQPHMGSLVYARALKASGEHIAGMIALETLGYYSDAPGSQHYPPPLDLLYPGRGDFVAFVGTSASRGFVRRTVAAFRKVAAFPSVGGAAPGFVRGVDWSDHWAFEQVGVPALMVTDTAVFRYPYYHGAADTPDKLDYARLARVVSGLEVMLQEPR